MVWFVIQYLSRDFGQKDLKTKTIQKEESQKNITPSIALKAFVLGDRYGYLGNRRHIFINFGCTLLLSALFILLSLGSNS
jgi:hypothetical protein